VKIYTCLHISVVFVRLAVAVKLLSILLLEMAWEYPMEYPDSHGYTDFCGGNISRLWRKVLIK